MDSGGWKVIYEIPPYFITDEGDYFSVFKDYKHIASFKTKKLADKYIFFKRQCRYFGN